MLILNNQRFLGPQAQHLACIARASDRFSKASCYIFASRIFKPSSDQKLVGVEKRKLQSQLRHSLHKKEKTH